MYLAGNHVDQAFEHELVLRAQAGDRQAFAGLVERYWGRLFRWLHGVCGCAHTAEDLTQEAFLKAWSHVRSFSAGTDFRAWLFRIGVNSFTDSKRRMRVVPAADLTREHASGEPGPVAAAVAKETRTQIQTALERLPVEFRTAFLLRIHESLSFREIAQVLDLTEETARWRVFKARRILLHDLGAYLDREKP